MEREGGHVGSFFERREEGERILKFEPSQNSNTARSPTVPLKKNACRKTGFPPYSRILQHFFPLETKLKCPTKDDFFLTRLSLFGHPLSVEETEVVKAGGKRGRMEEGGSRDGFFRSTSSKAPLSPSPPLPPPPSKVEEGSRGGERWRWKEY